MPSKRKRTRVAIGVFNRLERLARALDELAAQDGTHGTMVALLAAPEVLECGPELELTSERLAGLANAPAVILRDTGNPSGAARQNDGDIRPGAREHSRLARFEEWMEPRMADGLNRRLAHGDCLLFAIAATPDEEQEICRALIKYSAGQVQVHDLRLE